MTPRVCTVCLHPERSDIDALLVAGTPSLRNIAERFGISATALHRHKQDHLPQELVRAQDAQEIASAGDLLAEVQKLQARTLKILEQVEKKGDTRASLQAIREARGNLELLGRLIVAAASLTRQPDYAAEARNMTEAELNAEIEQLLLEGLEAALDSDDPTILEAATEGLRKRGYVVTGPAGEAGQQ